MKFDNTIVEEYEKSKDNCSGWYDPKNKKPHNSLIKGDKSTRINLEWFIEKNGEYYFTDRGLKNYEIWLSNNGLD